MNKHKNFKHIAQAMRQKRLSKGLTQSHVAKTLGIAQETVSRIEAGDGGVAFATVLGYMELLGSKKTLDRVFAADIKSYNEESKADMMRELLKNG